MKNTEIQNTQSENDELSDNSRGNNSALTLFAAVILILLLAVALVAAVAHYRSADRQQKEKISELNQLLDEKKAAFNDIIQRWADEQAKRQSENPKDELNHLNTQILTMRIENDKLQRQIKILTAQNAKLWNIVDPANTGKIKLDGVSGATKVEDE